MNEKILPDDIESKSLSELTDIADKLIQELENKKNLEESINCLLYTSPSPRDLSTSRMPSSA